MNSLRIPGAGWRIDPVLHRELRVQARSGRSARSRSGVAALAVLFLALVAGMSGFLDRPGGMAAFGALHAGMILMLALMAPLWGSAVIQQERREGTLPLLWLTPRRPTQILLGMAWAGWVKGGVAWVACVPVLLVPLMLGGVGWADVLIAVGVEFAVGLCGVAAGLMSGAMVRGTVPALLIAWMLMAGAASWIGVTVAGAAALLASGAPGGAVAMAVLALIIPVLVSRAALTAAATESTAAGLQAVPEQRFIPPPLGGAQEDAGRVEYATGFQRIPRPFRGGLGSGTDPFVWLIRRGLDLDVRLGPWMLLLVVWALEWAAEAHSHGFSATGLSVWLCLRASEFMGARCRDGTLASLVGIPGAPRALSRAVYRSGWAEFLPLAGAQLVVAIAASSVAGTGPSGIGPSWAGVGHALRVLVGAVILPGVAAWIALRTPHRWFTVLAAGVLAFKLPSVLVHLVMTGYRVATTPDLPWFAAQRRVAEWGWMVVPVLLVQGILGIVMARRLVSELGSGAAAWRLRD